jgi:putative PIN family toxin of toxin-antitoxin system
MNERREPRVVVDTNIFVSGTILKSGNPYQLVLRWKAGAFTLLLSAEQREEIAEVLQRPKIRDKYGLSNEDVADLVFFLDTRAEPVTTDIDLPLHARDPKDDMLLAAALAGGASYLVTGDADLLVLNGDSRLRGLKIITVRAFLAAPLE